MAAAFAIRNQNGQTYGLCFLLSAVRHKAQLHGLQSDALADFLRDSRLFKLDFVVEQDRRLINAWFLIRKLCPVSPVTLQGKVDQLQVRGRTKHLIDLSVGPSLSSCHRPSHHASLTMIAK